MLAVALVACSSSALALGVGQKPVLNPANSYDKVAQVNEWALANPATVTSAEQAALNAVPAWAKEQWGTLSGWQKNLATDAVMNAGIASAGYSPPACCGGCQCCGTGDNGPTGKNCPTPGQYAFGDPWSGYNGQGISSVCTIYPDCPADRSFLEYNPGGMFCCPR